MRAHKMCIATPLLKWYLQHGLVVSHIYQVIEYSPMACFRQFMDEVSDARRAGDADPDMAILADTKKLEGNSGYGSMIMDKAKHTDIMYVKGHGEAQLKINDPRFRKCQPIDDNLIEVEMAKRKIKFDLPIQIGYFILQYAKLRMLQFHYDFLLEFCDPRGFQHVEMDTDSFYLALGGSTLMDLMPLEKREIFQKQVLGQCDTDSFEANEHTYFPRECCDKHTKYDRRTPGLFKLEAKGDAIIAL